MHQTHIKIKTMASRIVFHALFFSFFVLGIHAITVNVKNNCGEKIWPATQTGEGGAPSTTGFELAPQAEGHIEIPADWTAGRIWARTGCSDAGTNCATGDCGSLACNGKGGAPPVTLVEITLPGGDSKTQNFYDISLVDGFNLPVRVSPEGGCRSIACQADINNQVCPPDLVVTGANGAKIACKSACLKTNSDQDCCKGAFDKAETCSPSEYSKVVKQACPDAYSYAFDDRSSTTTCPTGVNYLVEFCP